MTGDDGLRRLLLDFRGRLDVPATGAAVVTREGDLDIEVVGHRSRVGSEPVTFDCRWHIGSCAKAITAVLYARLVERGATEWGVPIRSLFPDLADEIDPAWSIPTVDEVLICRSGMRGDLSRAEMFDAWKNAGAVAEQRSEAVVSALSRPPRHRGRFHYSNLGYVVVGAAIDRITGMPFEAALHSHLLEPLGMNSVDLGAPPHIWGHRPKLKVGSLAVGRGLPVDPADPRSDNPAVMTPAGRLHLTLGDWAKFQRIFLNDGHPLLELTTIKHLLALPPDGRGMAMGWASAAQLPGASYGMQGSNTMWAATALIGTDRQRTVLVAPNDGRTRVLQQSARLASSILHIA